MFKSVSNELHDAGCMLQEWMVLCLPGCSKGFLNYIMNAIVLPA